jgi:biotin-[acetyl-CoA-carboxylase] ligase BirA-like protein
VPVYSDSLSFASALLPQEAVGNLAPVGEAEPGLWPLLAAVYGPENHALLWLPDGSGPREPHPWNHLLLSEFSPTSQYDQLIDFARKKTGLPDRVVCLAGAGRGFHGFKGRAWAATPGNLHLAVYLKPQKVIERFEVAFTILSALSVLDGLNQIGGLRDAPRIKWVNDILLGEGKVGGILAYTQSQGRAVSSAVLGIGVNVNSTPVVEPTPFVPRVTSVRNHLVADTDVRREVFDSLLGALDANYRTLLEFGVQPLLERYREHSLVVGEEVTVCTENSDHELKEIASGRVSRLGENLELFLEGQAEPVSGGRLILGKM